MGFVDTGGTLSRKFVKNCSNSHQFHAAVVEIQRPNEHASSRVVKRSRTLRTCVEQQMVKLSLDSINRTHWKRQNILINFYQLLLDKSSINSTNWLREDSPNYHTKPFHSIKRKENWTPPYRCAQWYTFFPLWMRSQTLDGIFGLGASLPVSPGTRVNNGMTLSVNTMFQRGEYTNVTENLVAAKKIHVNSLKQREGKLKANFSWNFGEVRSTYSATELNPNVWKSFYYYHEIDRSFRKALFAEYNSIVLYYQKIFNEWPTFADIKF